MKKIILLFVFLFSCLLSLVGMETGNDVVAKTKKQTTLLILHTNDSHSCIEPQNRNLADTLIAGRGGYIRRMAAIEEERNACPDLLLFDSGDFSQGSPYYTLYKGDVEVGLMNMMHYDAVTIGNHEFDFGLENMARLFRMAEFPIVCSNYDFTGTPVEGLVREYIVLERQGVKIGVFALCPQPDGLVSKQNYEGMKFKDPVDVARTMTDILKDEKKCDVVICLSHLGWDIAGVDDKQLIANTSDIDIVLGGHSHSYLTQLEYVRNDKGKEIPVDQNGKLAIFMGKIKMTLNRK